MAEQTSSPIVFQVAGTRLDGLAAEGLTGTRALPLRCACTVGARRDAGPAVTVEAEPGRDVVAVKIADGPLLLLHPEHARELLGAGRGTARGTPDGTGAATVTVTGTLPWSTAAASGARRDGRPSVGGAILEWFGVLDTPRPTPADGDRAAGSIAAAIDGQVVEGLYRLDAASLPESFAAEQRVTAWPAEGAAGPLLIFMHGTFVDTSSTFGKLWQRNAAPVEQLLGDYPGRAFAFEHPTICKSPIGNAIALAESLPQHAVLHLVTHSRAGLIADVLLRSARHEPDGVLARHFAGDARSLEELRALRTLLRTKNIVVQRVVRCACPARGTLLASRRLDAFLSVFQWLLGLAGVNVTTQFVDLLCEVARRRTSATAMPGLQAMMPDSPLIGWLNAPLDGGVDSELYVVAGDAAGDGVVSWLKTLVADGFFWTDNDMVVQTRSMYGGVPRAAGPGAPKFRLFTGPQATHFSYFTRPDLMAPVRAALRGEPGDDWRPIGAQSRAGLDSGGSRAALAGAPHQQAGNPAHPHVIVIPDVFGSLLAMPGGDVPWMDERSLARFAELAPPASPALVPAGLLPGHYADLCRHLAATHNVTAFAYDWRLDIDAAAGALAATVARLAAARRHAEQPIRVVAHGMGGLLVRALQARHPAAWRELTGTPAARIVLLGVPHGGSWLPLRMLSGDETFGRLFSAAGSLRQERAVRDTLAAMPGFLQLQAGLADPHCALRDVAGWRAAADAELRGAGATAWHEPVDGWAMPAEAALRQATAFWQQLDHALPGLLRDATALVTVTGQARGTVCAMDVGARGIELVATDRGDGHVTHDSALLHGVPAWGMPVRHEALPRSAAHFDAIADLLATGTTTRLPAIAGGARGDAAPADGAAPTRRRPLWHGSGLGAPENAATQLTAPAGADDDADDGRLTIRIHHGDLRFVKAPLLLGHYRALTLSGTEAVVDTLVGGRMTKALRAGVYPDRLGSFQIFENGRHHHAGRRKQRMIPRPRAAVIVGLGEEGKLTALQLAYTIRIGVLAFAERLTEDGAPPARFELAATLAGSGGSGVSVGAAALALAQGILDANVRLREAGWPLVEALTIVEVYLDRATDAWRVLRMQADTTPERLAVDGYLRQGEGSLRRPLESSYRGTTYDFISATRMEGSSPRMPLIAFSLDTRRARTEVRAQQAQGALVRDLVEGASNSARADGQIGRTLFNLLIPVEIEPYLAGSASMLMELDETTSTLPWELLDTDPEAPLAERAAPRRDDVQPWSIRCKVIRKLRTREYREQVVDAGGEDNMLVIGEPLADEGYGRLAGAQREAAAIATAARAAFGIHGDRVTLLEPLATARRVINQLFARNYRIVHIAGHGTGPRGDGKGDDSAGAGDDYGGVVLSGHATYLGVNEIMAMRVTPELVFLNCCHLAQGSRKPPYDRAAFAAGLAGALIDIGVRCVIAAGWAIEDGAAELFARTFYAELFAGQRFIDAVGAARLAAWQLDPGSNTWAAYQCYGDPDWSWKAASGSRYPTPAEEYGGVASPMALTLVLQAIATEALYSPHEDPQRNRARLAWLEQTFAAQGWTQRGDVAQEFGAAYAALPDRHAALQWLGRAVTAPDGSSALNTVELLAEQASLPGATPDELRVAIGYLTGLVDQLPPTPGRLGLLGNAYRRVSMLQQAAGDPAADGSLEQARQCFDRAAQCPAPGAIHTYFPTRARLACEVRASLLAEAKTRLAGAAPAAAGNRPSEPMERELAALARDIDQAANADPKFWSIVAQSEFDILKAVLQRELALHAVDIVASMKDLYKRIRTKRYWTHVEDDARALLEPYLAVLDDSQDAERLAARQVLDLLAGYATTVAPAA